MLYRLVAGKTRAVCALSGTIAPMVRSKARQERRTRPFGREYFDIYPVQYGVVATETIRLMYSIMVRYAS